MTINCCKLTESSKGIHDYAQMKRMENNYNPQKLTIWQLGVFEGLALLHKVLEQEKHLCEKCLEYTNQLHQIRLNWEKKLK